MAFRRILFWLHLATGVFAGLIILIMSVTGVLLTYEKQILGWADRRAELSTQSSPKSVEALLAEARNPVSVTIRSDGTAPKVTERGQPIVQDGTRRFFRTVTEWHRWLGAPPEGRTRGRMITRACNIAFLFLVVSGLYLWFPRKWQWRHIRAVLLFRGGLSGRARDFNWHNVAGFWCCVPLFFVVLSGVVISFPAARGPGQGKGLAERPNLSGVNASGLDVLLSRAKQEVPEWRTISFTVPSSHHGPVTFNIDAGTGGQPQKRTSLILDRKTGEVLRMETFSGQDASRRARSWFRFVHTGEYYGIAGQTVAGLASAGGALLVWTGLSLAWRRFMNGFVAR